MTVLTEAEILSRYEQSLGEASEACQHLARHADKDFIGLRGGDYMLLKRSLESLEGCARQMGHYRGDARWQRLGFVYARLMRSSHRSFLLQKWGDFALMRQHFDHGKRLMDDLATRRTGRTMSQGPILPSVGNTDWLRMPDYSPVWPGPRTVN